MASQFLAGLATGEPFEVVAPSLEDYARMAVLVDRYADLPLDAADASVIALAERLNSKTIATVDRKDFQIVRPRHIPFFNLVPNLDV